ncbi:MAG TPA: hypothetical protein VGN86_10765 [Pyrinomonadaceae bacterium]|nr:hypothetical protein [Pyrinomonadaceae bacterium]
MNTHRRLSFLFLLLLLIHSTASADAIHRVSTAENAPPNLSWNAKRFEAPFSPRLNGRSANVDGLLIYPSRDFSFPLLQELTFDSVCNCYGLMVRRSAIELELVNFWRTGAGFYRTASGPYLELQNLESLKSVESLDGTRFLFAEVADNEWRCVSIHDSAGNYLMIDYRADGLVLRIRDSQRRSAIPSYRDGRMISLRQVWQDATGRPVESTVMFSS